MTVVESPPTFGHLGRLREAPSGTVDGQSNKILHLKPCYLPMLVTKLKDCHREEVGSGTVTVGQQTSAEDVKQTHSEFRSRLRPSIYKGNYPSFAMDPEQHLQLAKERQALLEQRCRPKPPINLEPVHVQSLSKPKARKSKADSQRLTRSAPELMQQTKPKQELSYLATQTSKIQLPLLASDSSASLAEFIEASGIAQVPNRLISSEAVTIPNRPTYNGDTLPSESRLQVVTAAKLSQLKPTRHSKGHAKLLKTSQSSYAALREQRLLSEKLRAFDNENLLVDAQKYRGYDAENELEMVEQAQSQLRCPKTNGRRSCGICPPTAGVVRKGQINSASLPELAATSKEETSSKAKKALVVQLPNIMYSRANTPAAASVMSCRSAFPSAVGERLLIGKPDENSGEADIS